MPQVFEQALADLRRDHRLRVRRQVQPAVPPSQLLPDDESLRGTTYRVDGQARLSFGSNDYLGLSQHPAVIEAACRAASMC